MPTYAIILRGRWVPSRADYLGFFATRLVKAATVSVASSLAVTFLKQEWQQRPPLRDGMQNLQVTVVDSWRLSWFASIRRSHQGHTFYVEEQDEADAASIEAQAAHAPMDTSLWCIATPPGNVTSELNNDA